MLSVFFKDDFTDLENNSVILINNEKYILNLFSKTSSTSRDILSKLLENDVVVGNKFGDLSLFSNSSSSGEIKNYFIFCVGQESNLTEPTIQQLGNKFYQKINDILRLENKTVFMPYFSELGLSFFENFIKGALIGSYKFDKYKSVPKDQFFNTIEVISDQKAVLEEMLLNILPLVEGVFLAKNLSNEPANVLTPDYYAGIINQELSPLNISIQTLSEIDIRRLSMNALLAVGQGSINESKVIIMKYDGNTESEDIVGLVGKGVTFDTGGISLKPHSDMDQMKYDMAGSAAIVGLMKTLALRKARVNVVAIVGLVENMPGSNAQRPGDVVVSMSGKTIEVLNTDAEGRLVLCDCMHYLQTNFKVTQMIDVATLTGAVLVALGKSFAGCFSNDDAMLQSLKNAGLKTGERIWPLPLDLEFKELLDSTIADITNVPQKFPRLAGSSVAAEFLHQFVQNGVRWAHLDIAGVQTCSGKSITEGNQGASAFGVQLLDCFLKNSCE